MHDGWLRRDDLVLTGVGAAVSRTVWNHRLRCKCWPDSRSGNGVGHINKATSSPVNTGIGTYLWLVYHPGNLIPGHSALPSLRGWVQWLPAMVSATDGEKQRVLRISRPCNQDCWYTGLLYASLIGSNPRQLKCQRGWAPSRRTS